jgi:hypothetical protein
VIWNFVIRNFVNRNFLIINFVIRKLAIRNSVIRNFGIRNFLPVSKIAVKINIYKKRFGIVPECVLLKTDYFDLVQNLLS